jgi:DNA-binding transcriptional LysR family regulator
MDIGELRTFLAVLEHGSFSRAAEALRLGQSTVSFHVKALETAVGARLLDRHGGRVRSTATGAVLRRYALRIVSLREEALARLRAEESGQAGRLTIAASTIPGEYLLPPVLSRFLAAHPRVAVSVDVSDSRAALARLAAHECDLALVGARARDKRILCVPFADDEVVLVARADASSARSRLSPQELRHVRLVVREEGSGTRQAAAAFLARHAFAGGDHVAPLQVGSTEAVRRCALHGAGMALLSRHAVAEDVAAGRLALIPAPGLPVRRSFYAARLRTVTPSAAMKTLLKMLLENR